MRVATPYSPGVLQLRQTRQTGYGVFVDPKFGHSIPKHLPLGEYLGRFRPEDRHRPFSDYIYECVGCEPDALKLSYRFEIDAEDVGTWTRFVNAHCRHNVCCDDRMVGKRMLLVFYAEREIKPGEQLSVNYGRDYFKSRNMPCRCDAMSLPHWPPEDSV
jgi:SET domain-containing protein